MATRGSPQSQNRPSNVGYSNGNNSQRPMGDDVPNSDSKWLFFGMLFFAIVCFILLPLEVMMLIDIKKTNIRSQEALSEVKKIKAELKEKKNE